MNELNYSQSVVRQFHCLTLLQFQLYDWMSMSVDLLTWQRVLSLLFSHYPFPTMFPRVRLYNSSQTLSQLCAFPRMSRLRTRSVAHIGKWWCYDSIRFAGRHFDTAGFSPPWRIFTKCRKRIFRISLPWRIFTILKVKALLQHFQDFQTIPGFSGILRHFQLP